METEKKYTDLVAKLKEWHDGLQDGAPAKETLELILPDLKESEDERIRKGLIDYLKADMEHNPSQYPQFYDRAIAYLERQKEPKLLNNEKYQKVPIETLDRLYASEKELKEIKQKEQKPLSPEDKVKHPLYVEGFEAGKEVGRQCERVFGEQKPAEKQDYSGLTDFERAIHRGFLCAGVENVPVTIIKETAQECLAHIKPAEWSEEDRENLEHVIDTLARNVKRGSAREDFEFLNSLPKRFAIQPKQEWSEEDEILFGQIFTILEMRPVANLQELKKFLKSLRPSWKPSQEQVESLRWIIDNSRPNTEHETLCSLLDDLQKLI